MSEGSSARTGLIELQKRVLELQRSAFNSSFQAIDQLQKQQEELFENMIKQIPGMPADTSDAIESWTKMFRDSRQQYYDAAQKGFDLYARLIAGARESDDD